MERHVCQFQTVSTEGFTPEHCAPFCAHPRSTTIALCSSRGGNQIARFCPHVATWHASWSIVSRIRTGKNFRTAWLESNQTNPDSF
jgi:hypothetical protein